MILLINNKFVPETKAVLPINSSILRGYGVFETLRAYPGAKFFLAQKHIERLLESAKKINIKITYTPKQLQAMLKKIASVHCKQNQSIRIIALPEILILTAENITVPNKIYKGVKCMSVCCGRALPEIKSISYLASFISHERAAKYGNYDAVLTDEKEFVYEGAYSNLFWFEKNTLCTRQDKILPGITRWVILQIWPGPVKLKNIKLSELCKKSEIFLTSSLKNIVPVIKIDKHIIGSGQVGKSTIKLMNLFNQYIKKTLK
ncbi:MAG: aminotransferase class IV [Patescibacteria group bacterium]